MGEPAGIGPELLVKIAAQSFDAEIIVLAEPSLLQLIASEMSCPLLLETVDWNAPAKKHRINRLLIEPINLPEINKTGQLNSQNAAATLEMLNRAGQLALSKQVDAIVTAPVHKAILNQVDKSFLGHTEFFAKQANIAKVVMMLATDNLRVALATTHIPLSQVTSSIDQSLISQIITIIDQSFTGYNLAKPKIAVCGINPHAGEDGLLGTEDQTVVAPVVKKMQQLGYNVDGPFPSDSLFTKPKRDHYDIFLAMYHDQGLPVVKAIGFGQCANITLGLPYIRTSVDHGTALDIASQKIASPSSLEYAINYAIQLAKGQLPR